jgi:hypothetical protein
LVTGDATLLVTRKVNITGDSFIRILPGARLKLYVAAPRAHVAGQGVVNESSQPASFIYYGLPSNQHLAVSGEGEFAGVIYAPDTSLRLNGTGEFYGGVVAKEATMNGDFNFHFDESLGRLKELQHIQVVNWNEI